METKLEYKHISIVPRKISDLDSRSEASTYVYFCGCNLQLPIIAAPMPDVCNGKMAAELTKYGAFGIIHRFQSIEEQYNEWKIASALSTQVGASIGVTDNWQDRFEFLFQRGCYIWLIDIANGASKIIEKVIKHIKKYSIAKIIAGNVASREGFLYLSNLGVDAIRVGIAGGSVCETKTETGIYYPMASLIEEVVNEKNKNNLSVSIIADGGIKEPRDMCKALALGANTIMVGGILAGCEESPSKTLKIDGKIYKILRGAASFSVQQDYNKEPKYVEGRETLVPFCGKVEDVLTRFKRGLESSMSYLGARTLTEYVNNASFVINFGV